MKAIQITIDEQLLERLDSYPDAGHRGRSAIIREAVADYLAKKEAEEIDRAYERGYREFPPDEFKDWVREPIWPD